MSHNKLVTVAYDGFFPSLQSHCNKIFGKLASRPHTQRKDQLCLGLVESCTPKHNMASLSDQARIILDVRVRKPRHRGVLT
jgi:hypothetical protein